MVIPPAAWCSFIRWTCYNTVFLLFWVHAHNAVPWRHEFGAPFSIYILTQCAKLFWLCLVVGLHISLQALL